MMADREFWSVNRQFGMKCPEKVLKHILGACKQSGLNETGGILVGFYEERLDCAQVTAATSAPDDSRKGRTWFHRGTDGLQTWLNDLWHRKRNFYLGEWHFHPFAPPMPSRTDVEQMQQIANAPSYHCPEPLLLLIGGDPSTKWTMSVFVFSQERNLLVLFDVSERTEEP